MHEFGQLFIGGTREAAGGECLKKYFEGVCVRKGIGHPGEGGWIGEYDGGFVGLPR